VTPPVPPPRVVLDEGALRERVTALAAQISADHPDGVILVGVLKGALVFLADLARAIQAVDVELDFLAISRYAPDSGRVRILQDLALDVAGRDVVLVEDLIDTGLTLAYLLGHVRDQGPRRVEVCALLDRAERRIVPLDVRYVGIEVPGDAFLLGYGLHFAERYRNLPVVVAVDQAAVRADPDAYLGIYQGSWSAPSDGAAAGATSREGIRDPR
jgi:hypoxanthine phosphoribosyltransferase